MKRNNRIVAQDMAGPIFWFASGAVAGSLISFFCDPSQGARRRSLVTDKFSRVKKTTSRNASRVARNLNNRAHGILSTYTHFRHSDVDDDVLNQRVRSQLGHLVDHAHSIETAVRDGVVTVSGPALSVIAADMIKFIKNVPGVKDVIDELDVQPSAVEAGERRADPNPLLQ